MNNYNSQYGYTKPQNRQAYSYGQQYNSYNFSGNNMYGNTNQQTNRQIDPRKGNSREVNAAYQNGQNARSNVPQEVKQKGTQMFNNVAQLEKDFVDLAPQLQKLGVNTRQVKSQLSALTNVIANFAENKKRGKNTL